MIARRSSASMRCAADWFDRPFEKVKAAITIALHTLSYYHTSSKEKPPRGRFQPFNKRATRARAGGGNS
jgi:hypothetical protein